MEERTQTLDEKLTLLLEMARKKKNVLEVKFFKTLQSFGYWR